MNPETSPTPLKPDGLPDRVPDGSTAPSDNSDREPIDRGGANSSSPASPWRELPLPDDPDRHDEFYCCSTKVSGGLRVVGASVRGKKHKHEGLNRDDWFQVDCCGGWTIIAASDGAGSRKFSRVGARVACAEAVALLSDRLAHHTIASRDAWTAETFTRDASHGFLEPDLATVQTALIDAMEAAREAVESAASLRASSPAHEVILGRPINVDDLSATLILAVHTIVAHRGVEYSLILACQIGDGMSAAVFGNGALQLLGTADGGRYSGETAFLASASKLGRMELSRRTHIGLGPLKALMVMTDGVADDYFPNNPGLHQLYDDLLEHQIVELPGSETRKATTDGIDESELRPSSPTSEAADERSEGAAVLGSNRPLAGFDADPAIHPATSGEKTPSPEARLRRWLDSYHVRGSFDDRTLIILSRGI